MTSADFSHAVRSGMMRRGFGEAEIAKAIGLSRSRMQ